MSLTVTKIRAAKAKNKEYKLLDSHGLYLEVRPTGKKYWRCRFCIDKKEGVYTIGEYPSVSLSEARQQREWVKQQAKQLSRTHLVPLSKIHSAL